MRFKESLPSRDVVVLGYGDETRALLAHLASEQPSVLARVLVVDPDPHAVDRARATGAAAVRADPFDPAELRRAGIERACVVISLAVPGSAARGASPSVVRLARALCPDARVLVSATGDDHARELRLAGAHEVFLASGPPDLARSLDAAAVPDAAAAGARTLLGRALRSMARFLDAVADGR